LTRASKPLRLKRLPQPDQPHDRRKLRVGVRWPRTVRSSANGGDAERLAHTRGCGLPHLPD
jgi:hypothetical protein